MCPTKGNDPKPVKKETFRTGAVVVRQTSVNPYVFEGKVGKYNAQVLL